MKKAKWIFPTIIFLIVAALVAVNHKAIAAAFKPKGEDENGSDGSSNSAGSSKAGSGGSSSSTKGSTGSTAIDVNKTLKKGVKGAEVSQLQNMLNQNFASLVKEATKGALLVVDGDFGTNTEAACKNVLGTAQTNLKAAYAYTVALKGAVSGASGIYA